MIPEQRLRQIANEGRLKATRGGIEKMTIAAELLGAREGRRLFESTARELGVTCAGCPGCSTHDCAPEAVLRAVVGQLHTARETIERLTKERDNEAREAAGYQKIAREAVNAEQPGLLVLLVDQQGAEVRIFGPDRDAEERFGETLARWWKLLQATSEGLELEDRTKERDAARAENERLTTDRNRLACDLAACVIRADKATAEVERLQGIIDDTEAVAGLCDLQVDEAVEEYPTLPDFVRGLRAGFERVAKQRDELAKAVLDAEALRIKSDSVDSLDRGRVDLQIDESVMLANRLAEAVAAEQPKPAEVCIKCKASSFADAKTLCMPCDGGSCPGDDLWHGQEQPKPAGSTQEPWQFDYGGPAFPQQPKPAGGGA